MTWTYELSEPAQRRFGKLDKTAQTRILKKLRSICASGDPAAAGKPLESNLRGFRRYRVGDYRIVASIEEGVLVVLVLTVGHRSRIYQDDPRKLRTIQEQWRREHNDPSLTASHATDLCEAESVRDVIAGTVTEALNQAPHISDTPQARSQSTSSRQRRNQHK